MKTIGERLDEYKGIGPGFDFIRVALAFGVIAWHSVRLAKGLGEQANMPVYWRLYGWLLGLSFRMKTVAQGAAAPCYVATHPQLARVSGAYFEDCRQVVPGGYMQDHELAARLWEVSTELARPYLKSGTA